MAKKFITNKSGETSLSEYVEDLTKKGSKLDFLVGYFFFSGFCEIYKDIKDKPLRILVGMDAEVDLNNCICEYTTILGNKKNFDSKATIKNKYFESLKEAINKADILDAKDFEDSYRVFIKKLENGTLEVRKTKEPNHAKMYLFYLPKGAERINDESKIIIGSSNFSLQGFKARNEINVYLQDENDFEDGKQIFEELWQDSIPLASKENKDELENVLVHTWLEAVPTPYLMYVRTLYEYFKKSDDYIKTPKELTRGRMNEFFDASYQVDAIRDGVAKVKKHSGVIVADVVGLGKSIIASAIAANLDKRTVIISPPHLKSQWEDYAADFGLRGCKVYTSGKIEEAAKENKNHTGLVIIIDEAHRYRNENTQDYGFLHQLCAGNQVILLSATPFNNRPEDIFSLIKLFQIPSNSTIQTVNNLGNQMAELVTKYKKLKKEHRQNKGNDLQFNEEANEIARQIRDILDPVVIRRTRVDLEKMTEYKDDLKANGIEFSDVKPPVSQKYELGDLSELYINTLNRLTDKETGFKGTRYKPLTYLKADPADKSKIDKKLVKKYAVHFDDIENFTSGQRNMADFMKQLLVRRFESSKYSFVCSLENITKSMKVLRKWFTEDKKIPMAKNTKLPDIDELEAMMSDNENGLFSDDEILESALNSKNIWWIDAQDVAQDFLSDLDCDISLLEEFLQEWNETKADPKLETIEKNIRDSIQKEPERKIIIFTEFSDTADYLFENFKKNGVRAMMYSSKIASKTNRDLIRSNFDAGIPKNLQRNDFDVLVATDAISEGFSLHRAGTIYNYDIPYNPTRVIQRVGRINRINKKVFDELYIYNFFPTATGEEVSHTAEISTFKMKLFQAILGADTQILTSDEAIDGYLGKKFVEAQNEENTESWDVKYKNELKDIKDKHRDILEAALELPQRCRIARNGKQLTDNSKQNVAGNAELFTDIQQKGVLLFSKKGDSYRFGFTSLDGKSVMLNPENALALFEAKQDEKGEKVSDSFYPIYEKAKQSSGHVNQTKQNSKNIQDALSTVTILKNKVQDKNDKEYLEGVRNVVSWDSLPLYYMKQIAKISVAETNALEELKQIVPENYLETLIEKNNKVGSESETVLLAEEIR